jgi:hypothetical protein
MAPAKRARGIPGPRRWLSFAYRVVVRRVWPLVLLSVLLGFVIARDLRMRWATTTTAAGQADQAQSPDTLPLYHESAQQVAGDVEGLRPVEGSLMLAAPGDAAVAPAALTETRAGADAAACVPPTLPWPMLSSPKPADAPNENQSPRDQPSVRPWVDPIARPWVASAAKLPPASGDETTTESEAPLPELWASQPEIVEPLQEGAPERPVPRTEPRPPVPRRDTYTAEVQRMLKPIREVTNSVSPPPGDFDPDVPDEFERPRLPRARELCASAVGEVYGVAGMPMRPWHGQVFAWEAPGLYHCPLYFQEVTLERYGYSWGLAQPAVSVAHFFGRIPALPYLMTVDPPLRCVYTLGHYRPGSCVPPFLHTVPFDPLAAAVQGGVVTGLVYLIP